MQKRHAETQKGNAMKPQIRAAAHRASRLAYRANRARGYARLTAVIAAALFASAANAQQQDPQAAQSDQAPMASEIGHSAHAWLELQSSNAQAAPALPTLGAEAGYAYDRYLNSFKTPIPASFGSSVQSGSSGGQGSGFSGSGGGQIGGAY